MGHFFHLPRISPSVPFWVGLPDWRVEMAHRRSDGGVGDSLFGCASNLLERMRVFHSCHCSRAFWAPCFRFPTDNPPFFLKVCDGSWKAVFFFVIFFHTRSFNNCVLLVSSNLRVCPRPQIPPTPGNKALLSHSLKPT